MEMLAEKLEKLSPRERQAIELKAQGLTRAETARILGVSAHQVKSLWQHAKWKMSAQMTPDERKHYLAKLSPQTIRFGSLSNLAQI